MSDRFRDELENKGMGPLNWRVWVQGAGKSVWQAGRDFERLANVRDVVSCVKCTLTKHPSGLLRMLLETT